MTRPDDRLIRFLLGDIDEAEREAIERECFRPDLTTFDDLAALEDELRMDYVQGTLAAQDRARYEARFLASPEGREHLAFARTLAGRLAADPRSSAPARQPWWARRAVAVAMAASVVLLASASVLLWQRSRALESELRAARQGAATVASAPAMPSADARAALALTLTPNLTRDAGATTPSATASAAADGLRLVLQLPRDAASSMPYAVRVTDPDGGVVWTGTAAASPAGAVAVIPRALPPNDYQVDLGTAANPTALATYQFRIRRG